MNAKELDRVKRVLSDIEPLIDSLVSEIENLEEELKKRDDYIHDLEYELKDLKS